jgi:hypothetical protein
MATAPAATTTAPALLPVAEAARALGVSVSAVRRGLKSGRYRGQRQETPQGFVWLVAVGTGDDDRVGGDRVGGLRVGDDRIRELRVGDDRVGGGRQTADHAEGSPESSPSPQKSPQGSPQRPPGPQTALLAQRAEEMARYSAALLAPLHAELKAQAEELGRVKNELGHLQAERDAARAELERATARIAELETPAGAAEAAGQDDGPADAPTADAPAPDSLAAGPAPAEEAPAGRGWWPRLVAWVSRA